MPEEQMQRKRIIIDQSDNGCEITVWDDREGRPRAASKIHVFTTAAEALAFLTTEAAGFTWGGA